MADVERSGPGRNAADALFVGMAAICDTAARLTGVDGAAVAVMTDRHGVRELVYATDALAQQIDELQFTVGEGPCLDAYHDDRPWMCPRLDDEDVVGRWPGFISEITELGVAALFAFPIPGPHRPAGVLELYRRTSGELLEREQQSAQVCASALQAALDHNWRTFVEHSDSTEDAIATAAAYTAGPADPFTRSQVHVAAGMVAAQLSIPTGDSLDRLRAYAYAHRRSILAVAADVVARRLSFRKDNGADT
ncbi:MAG: hypothetical protein K0R68_2289 [Mycobacterium sp.]|jgi:hypothetical protein|nr:hypothetical protein [Mycobacterium sp.]